MKYEHFHVEERSDHINGFNCAFCLLNFKVASHGPDDLKSTGYLKVAMETTKTLEITNQGSCCGRKAEKKVFRTH